MRLTNSKERYGAVHRLLHWGMAAMVITAIGLGLAETQYGLHKSLGVTVLALVGLRLIWRFVNHLPALPPGMNGLQRFLAHAVHWLMYALMIFMPLCGWLMSNAAGRGVSFWGYYDLPVLIEKNKTLLHWLKDAHELGGKLFMGLIALHVLATFYHQFIRRDGLLWRMVPGGRRRVAMLNLSAEEKRIIEKAPWQ